MFDVSFTELMLIGVVALVVLGPERLPKVARTVGHLLGRAQRYVNDVKSDIQREIDLEEMNKLKKQMDEAAQSLQASMHETTSSLKQPFEEARDSISESSASVESLMDQARRELPSSASAGSPSAAPAADGPSSPASAGQAGPVASPTQSADKPGTAT